jgi:hypothetical protein
LHDNQADKGERMELQGSQSPDKKRRKPGKPTDEEVSDKMPKIQLMTKFKIDTPKKQPRTTQQTQTAVKEGLLGNPKNQPE